MDKVMKRFFTNLLAGILLIPLVIWDALIELWDLVTKKDRPDPADNYDSRNDPYGP